MCIAFSHENRLLQWPVCGHPASSSSLPILHADTRFLFQGDSFHCASLLKTSNYFLTYRSKVGLLSLMFQSQFKLVCFSVLSTLLLFHSSASCPLEGCCSIQHGTMQNKRITLKNISSSSLNLPI